MKKFNFSKGLIVGLLTFALCIVAFAAVGASADEAQATAPSPVTAGVSYDTETNTITAPIGTVIYVLKKTEGNTIKAGAACFTVPAAGKIAVDKLGIKGTKKDAYFYLCDKKYKEAADGIAANFTILGQEAKKITGVIDYTKADIADSTTVLSITATNSAKESIANPECIWSAKETGPFAASTEFTGAVLNGMLKNGGTIFVKMVGKDSPATFSSQIVKVKIAKQAKAPKVKYDYKKDTVAISNGFDFAVATKTEGKYSVAGNAWFTVLPFLKDAGTETASDSIVATTNFVPLSKKDENATKTASENGNKVSYTKYKFKAISVDTVMSQINVSDDFILAVRKSATEKKPASDVTYIEFKKKTAAPIVYTSSNVKDQYDVAATEDFTKKGFLIGTVKNYNGTTGTSGYDDSFTLKTSEQGDGVDKNPAAYEYIVVNTADLNTIDWASASWKKLDPAKTKITGKLKSKYDTATEKGVTAQLTETDKPQNFTAGTNVPAEAETVLLVRRSGAKGTAPVRPSNFIKLYVISDGETTTLYSTVANGEEAQAYQIDFYTLKKNNNGAFVWTKDESIVPVKGWGDKGENKTEKVKFPTITAAKFYAYDGSTVGDEYTASEGKYTITVAASIKVAVDVPVKVTYDLNKPNDLTLGNGVVAPAAANTVKGKITPAATTNLKGTKTVEGAPVNWNVTGWTLDKEGTKAVSADTVYGEDTTIYAKWEEVTG